MEIATLRDLQTLDKPVHMDGGKFTGLTPPFSQTPREEELLKTSAEADE